MRLPELFKECVDAMSPTTYFMYGNWVELCIDLGDKGRSKTYQDLRYPLVFLHNEFRETEKNNRITADSPKVYLIVQSKQGIYTQQRYDENYVLNLYPMLDRLFAQMLKGSRFQKVLNRFNYKKTDLYNLYVGDKKESRLPDTLDAIEISFTDLKYYKN